MEDQRRVWQELRQRGVSHIQLLRIPSWEQEEIVRLRKPIPEWLLGAAPKGAAPLTLTPGEFSHTLAATPCGVPQGDFCRRLTDTWQWNTLRFWTLVDAVAFAWTNQWHLSAGPRLNRLSEWACSATGSNCRWFDLHNPEYSDITPDIGVGFRIDIHSTVRVGDQNWTITEQRGEACLEAFEDRVPRQGACPYQTLSVPSRYAHQIVGIEPEIDVSSQPGIAIAPRIAHRASYDGYTTYRYQSGSP